MTQPKHLKILVIVFLIGILLFNLPFLPGPNFLNAPGQLFMHLGFIFALIGICAVPIGIIWTIMSYKKKRPIFRPLLYTTILLTPLLSSFFLIDIFRDFGRNLAIKNGNKLVEQIEQYQLQNGKYPENLAVASFNIPSSNVIGVEKYKYVKKENGFELTFNQNLLLGYNWEIVTYNNKNQHVAEGKLKTLYPTKYPKWKYYIFD